MFAEYLVQEFRRKGSEEDLYRYNWLFKIFEMPQFAREKPVEVQEAQINLDDIPF